MSIQDDFASTVRGGYDSPFTKAVVVSPSDSADLPFMPRALYVGTAGTLSVLLIDGATTVNLGAVAAGTLLPLRVNRVRSTGTGASNIVALA
jgi:hypothetical protein